MLTKRNLILICIGIGVIVLVWLFVSGLELRAYRNSQRTKTELENELAQISAPSGATFIRHSVIMKGSHGTISNLYESELPYDLVRAHYDNELSKHGWKFQSVRRLTTWGKDLGQTETVYCRGNQKADIFWTGDDRTRENIRYALGFSWGHGRCR